MNFLYLEVITRPEYYANPFKYNQVNVYIDEFDESVVETPYDIRPQNNISGIWELKRATSIFTFTATHTSGDQRLAGQIFGEEPTVFKFKSEYEFVTEKDPINTSIVCNKNDDPNHILDLICEEIEAIYE